MHIVADENIPFISDAFSLFGSVKLIAGRSICRSDLMDADILIVRSVTPVTKELLQDTPVKFVATATVGIDHIDTIWLKKQKIGFAYAPGSNAVSVAQYVLSALMSISHNKLINLKNAVIGIVGVGHIGSLVHRYAEILGIRTILCDPPRRRVADNKQRFHSLEEVVRNADIITFHVPLINKGIDSTYHMIDSSLLRIMKKGVCLINTSRGKIIDEKAVIDYSSTIGALVLDVWDNEPYLNEALLQLSDIATPHIAGYSFDGKVMGTEAVYKAACMFFNYIPKWLASEELSKDIVSINGISNMNDQLGSIILQAYPIENDTKELKKMLQIDIHYRAEKFDLLRKKYQKRLEFSHYAISENSYSEVIIKKLEHIGFRIV